MGVVEGFYGKPWAHPTRLAMLSRLGTLGLTAYLFAPKDDPKHRAAWHRPYDAAELDDVKSLCRRAEDSGVDLIWALSPQRMLGTGDLGDRRDFDADGICDADWYALSYKVDQLTAAGIRKVALSFDDTWATWLRAKASESVGRLHARVCNRVLERMQRFPEADVILVPARYFGRPDELSPLRCAYARGLAEMWPEIATVWTGESVFSTSICGADVERLSMALQRPVVIWNNAIANDWIPLATGERLGRTPLQKLCFAPPENLGPDVLRASGGVLLNGAREGMITEVLLDCLAAYVKSPAGYDGWATLQQALADRFPSETADALMMVAQLTQRHRYASPDRVEGAALRQVIGRYHRSRASSAEVESLLLRQLRAARHLAVAMPGSALWDEVGPSVEKMEHYAQAGLAAVRGRVAERKLHIRRARQVPWLVSSAGIRSLG